MKTLNKSSLNNKINKIINKTVSLMIIKQKMITIIKNKKIINENTDTD